MAPSHPAALTNMCISFFGLDLWQTRGLGEKIAHVTTAL